MALTITTAWTAAGAVSRATRLAAWRYAVPGSRDYRIDLLRGFLVFAMVVDHIGGRSPLTAISGDNQFLTSAAEGFIFISGLLMGIVYGGRVRRLGLAEGVKAVLRRAAVLYVTTVTLTLTFVGLYLFTSVPIWMDRSSGLGVARPIQAVVGALTLHYSYHGTDILLIYVLLVGAAPLAFYLLATGRARYVLGASWGLWALFQVFPEQADLPWAVANSVSFPFAAWQVLFYTGLVAGYHRLRLAGLARALSRWPALALLGSATAGLIALSQLHLARHVDALGLPWLTAGAFEVVFDKHSLGPGRVIAFLVVAGLAQQLVTRLWVPINGLLGWFLVPLGQKSLLAYGAHLFVIGPTWALFVNDLYGPQPNELVNAAIQGGALLLVWALVKAEPALLALAGRAAGNAQRPIPLAGARPVVVGVAGGASLAGGRPARPAA